MDNAVAVAGGRNIGYHYFEVHAEANFRDLDIAAGGPVVRERIAEDDYPYPLNQEVAELKSELAAIFDDFIWAPAQVVWDDSASIAEQGGTSRMIEGLFKRMGRLEYELLTESDGQELRYDEDPKSTGWQRFMAGFIKILPIEGQLRACS